MELTPIKIRGKKRKHLATEKEVRIDKSATQSSSQASSQATEQIKLLRKAKIKKKSTIFAMPSLQGLPQELLEIVFLYSGNIALPRCSPTLGRKLSSRAVIMEFTMQAFFHTVDHRTNYRDRRRTSDPYVQSEVLSSRFFTYDFFLTYVQRAHDAMIKLRGKVWEHTGIPVPGVEKFEGLWPFKFTTIPYLGFAERVHIPEKLLRGPWTKDKSSLLYVLVSLNGEIDWEGSMAGEAAKIGIKEAIREGNEYAVAALSVLLGVPKAITTDLLRYAVIQCKCPMNIMRHLLFNAQILSSDTSKEVLDYYDPKLWAWADANGDTGDVLKGMLKMADAFDLEFYFEEDVDWTKVVSFPYGGSKFDARTTLDGVVRELLRNLYQNYGRKITRRVRRAPV